MVLGLEALRAQCVFLNKEDEAALVKAFSNDSIHYCAGNAFNSYCIDAMMVATLVALAKVAKA